MMRKRPSELAKNQWQWTDFGKNNLHDVRTIDSTVQWYF